MDAWARRDRGCGWERRTMRARERVFQANEECVCPSLVKRRSGRFFGEWLTTESHNCCLCSYSGTWNRVEWGGWCMHTCMVHTQRGE